MCEKPEQGWVVGLKGCKYHSVPALCFTRSQSASERRWQLSGDLKDSLIWEIRCYSR